MIQACEKKAIDALSGKQVEEMKFLAKEAERDQENLVAKLLSVIFVMLTEDMVL